MTDQEIRTLERRAKQTRADEDIRAWLLALLRADQPLPISDYGWWLFGTPDPRNICRYHDAEATKAYLGQPHP